MTSIKKLILLVSAFLGVFFYTSSVSAFTASDGKEYTIVNGGNTTGYRVFKNGFLFLDWYPLFGYNQADPVYYPTKGISLFDKLGDTSISLWKFSPASTTQSSLWIVDHSTNSVQCFLKATTTSLNTFVNSIATIQHKGNYIKFLTSTGGVAGYFNMGCGQITQAEVDALPPYVPSTPACSSDSIFSGGNCSCSPTGEYFISGATTPLTFTWGGKTLDPANIKTNSTYRFSANKAKSYTVSYDEGTWKPDPNLINIDVSSFGGTTVNHVILGSSTGQLSTDSSMVQGTNSLVDFKEIDQYIKVTVSGENSKENLFNSIYINSSTGVTFPTLVTHRFAVYYATQEISWGAAAEANLNPWADQDWKYVGDYGYNTRIDLPYGSNARYLKIVPLQTASYVKAISLFNVPYEQEVSCRIITDEEKLAIISGSGTGSSDISNFIDSIGICGLSGNIPLVGSALYSMCSYTTEKIKSITSSFSYVFKMYVIGFPASPPTGFGIFPKFDFNSDGTVDVSTQTGSAVFSSGMTNVSHMKLVPQGGNMILVNSIFFLIGFILYFAFLLASWASLLVSFFIFRFVFGYISASLDLASSNGNIFSLLGNLPFFAAISFFVGSFGVAFVSGVLPILTYFREFVLFVIVNMDAFAPGTYSLLAFIFISLEVSLKALAVSFVIKILFDKFARLN